VLDIEDVDNVDRSEECDDFAEDFVDISMRRIQEEIRPTFICPSQISMDCFFPSTLLGLSKPMRAGKLEAALA
jgi:hypothetical protein